MHQAVGHCADGIADAWRKLTVKTDDAANATHVFHSSKVAAVSWVAKAAGFVQICVLLTDFVSIEYNFCQRED